MSGFYIDLGWNITHEVQIEIMTAVLAGMESAHIKAVKARDIDMLNIYHKATSGILASIKDEQEQQARRLEKERLRQEEIDKENAA